MENLSENKNDMKQFIMKKIMKQFIMRQWWCESIYFKIMMWYIHYEAPMKQKIKSTGNKTCCLVKECYRFYSGYLRLHLYFKSTKCSFSYWYVFKIGNKLNLYPEKNPVEPIFNSDKIRFFPKWNFKIVYRIEKNRIYILDIFSTFQNPKSFKL